MKRALLIGATGLTGSHLLNLLLKDKDYIQVIAITRQPLGIRNDKLYNIISNFHDLDIHRGTLVADDVFCCIGTTIKDAGSKDAFRKVDFEYPLTIAGMTRSNGAQQFLLMSSIGANERSMIFYSKVKGEIEQAIIRTGFMCTHILRPSMLKGERKKPRPAEKAFGVFYKLFDFLIPKKYKAIDASRVAAAMLALAKENNQGVFIHESDEIQTF